MDKITKEERSRVMASVKSRNTKSTEIAFITLLKEHNITGWRRNYGLPGKPDFVFLKERIAIFLDGCFWHGCPKHCRMPSSNVNYWNKKINGNKHRDRIIAKELKKKNWQVIRIWEHDIKKKAVYNRLEKKIVMRLVDH